MTTQKQPHLLFSNTDLVHHLCTQFLSPVSFACLMRAVPEAWRSVQRHRPRSLTMQSMVGARVERALAVYYKSDRVARAIRHELDHGTQGLVLTGGFLAAVLNGDSVDDCRDVDLFVPSTTSIFVVDGEQTQENWLTLFNTPTLNLCRTLAGDFEDQWTHAAPPEWQGELHKHVLTNIRCYGTIRNILDRIVSFQINGRKLQFLQAARAHAVTVATYIASFDLAICKSYYGGGTGNRDSGCPNFWTTRETLDSLCARVCHVHITNTYGPAYMAAEQQCGYVGKDTYHFCSDTFARLCKYRERGYAMRVLDNPENFCDVHNADDASWGYWNAFWRKKIKNLSL